MNFEQKSLLLFSKIQKQVTLLHSEGTLTLDTVRAQRDVWLGKALYLELRSGVLGVIVDLSLS